MATRSNIGISDIINLLKKSGAPVEGSSFDMGQAMPGLKQSLSANVGQGKIPEHVANYKAQLAQVAAMDQKLAGVYADPSSKLFIEDPMARERLYQGAANTGYGAVNEHGKQIQDEESQLASQVQEAEAVFGDLKTATAQQEAEDKRVAKAAKKGTGKSTGSSKTIYLAGEKLTADQAAKVKRLGIQGDEKAMSEFLYKSPDGFAGFLLDEKIDGNIKDLDAKKIKQIRQQYEAEKKKATTANKKTTAAKKSTQRVIFK